MPGNHTRGEETGSSKPDHRLGAEESNTQDEIGRRVQGRGKTRTRQGYRQDRNKAVVQSPRRSRTESGTEVHSRTMKSTVAGTRLFRKWEGLITHVGS